MKNPMVVKPGKETWREWKARRHSADFNFKAHQWAHRPGVLNYTSRRYLDTTVGSAYYPRRAGRIMRVGVNVQVAPTSTMTWTLLKNGTSVFTTNPTLSNESGSFPAVDDMVEWIDNPEFFEGDYLQFQITTVGGATGPMVAVIEYESLAVR